MTTRLLAGGAPLVEHLLELLLGLLLVVAQCGRLLEVLLLDRLLLLDADLFDLGLLLLDRRRAGHGPDAGLGAGFVHDVDRLVGQEAAGQVARGELDRSLDRLGV